MAQADNTRATTSVYPPRNGISVAPDHQIDDRLMNTIALIMLGLLIFHGRHHHGRLSRVSKGRSALLKEPVIIKNPASLSYDVFTWLNTYATWFVTATPMVSNVRDVEGYLHRLWKEAFAIEMPHFADPESLAVIYTETYI
ncbi:hypothetical protein CSOJ01_14249 [Colletotrichum sojae]|uniref:Uncharacterized protein n=1 Tax=Colletotrichum sojae TaxID=2175907 RepID=A0A8H6IRA2_9PEZI|nr:hypothetical protein CSOJ01_14249 [Colletotrichum sojae]